MTGRARVERWLWAALVVVNLVTHLVSLGERAMSHDESLHAFYSRELALRGEFRHDPMMHGPYLFHSTALVFRLLGESDLTARLSQAVLGVGLVPALWLYRRYLGRAGALLAALLVTISPSLLFYGRYARNDVPMAFFGLLWVYAALRYHETRRLRFLYLLAAAMSISFCAKETAFLSGATFGSFFAGRAAVRALRGRERLRESPSAHVAVVMLTLVMPFLVALVHVAMGWDPADFDSPQAQARALALVPAAMALSALLAFAWSASSGPLGLRFGTWLRLAGAFWVPPLVLFTTGFANLRRGLTSGIVGSLGYWLGQHEVGRGSQPWFYYAMLAAVYEPLALACALAGLAWLLRRRADTLLVPLCAWWVASSFGLYSWAGEKMPWLLVHLALPMSLLAAWTLSRLWSMASRSALALGLLGTAGLLGAYTFRSALRLTFVNGDLANELLVYAHGTPDLKRVLAEIREIAARTGEGNALPLAYDDDSSWPLNWYLRDFHKQRYLGDRVEPPGLLAPVVLIGSRNVAKAEPHLARDYVRHDHRLIWWPPEDYMRWGPRDLASALADPARRRRLWRYLAWRETGYDPADWPLRHDFSMFVRRDLAAPRLSSPP